MWIGGSSSTLDVQSTSVAEDDTEEVVEDADHGCSTTDSGLLSRMDSLETHRDVGSPE